MNLVDTAGFNIADADKVNANFAEVAAALAALPTSSGGGGSIFTDPAVSANCIA